MSKLDNDNTNSKILKNYEYWSGNNDFYLQGSLIFSNLGLAKTVIVSIFLFIYGSYCIILPFLYFSNLAAILITSCLSLVLMFLCILCYCTTSCTEPGIVDKNSMKIQKTNKDLLLQKSKRLFKIFNKGKVYDYKLCHTCLIIRSNEISHCGKCNNCIKGFDHHCIWTGNCIGERNYKYFFFFLLFLTILLVTSLIVNIEVFIYTLSNIGKKISNGLIIKNWIVVLVISIVTILTTLIVGYFIVKLFIFHCYLSVNNLTTKAYIKQKDKIPFQRVNQKTKHKSRYFYPNDIFQVEKLTVKEEECSLRKSVNSLPDNHEDIGGLNDSSKSKINKTDIIATTNISTENNIKQIVEFYKKKSFTDRKESSIINSLVSLYD